MNYNIGGTKTITRLENLKIGDPFESIMGGEICIKSSPHNVNKDYFFILDVKSGETKQQKGSADVIVLYVVEPPKFDYVSSFKEVKE